MAYNKALLGAIKKYFGKDAITGIATTLIESGGNIRAVGDSGNSGGAWQENSAGRGSGIPMQQRFDPVASTRRAAKEFASFRKRGFSGAELAYRAQRPADRASYIRKFNAALPKARQIAKGAGLDVSGVQTNEPGVNAKRFGTLTTGTVEPRDMFFDSVMNMASQGDRMSTKDKLTQLAMGLINQRAEDKRAEQASAGLTSTTPGQQPQSGGGGGKVNPGKGPLPGGTWRGGPNAGTHTLGNWQSDNAYDIFRPAGAPTAAVEPGVVVKVSGGSSNPRFAGHGVTVRGESGQEYFYKHIVAAVKPGQRVTLGQNLGGLHAATAGGPHLHFGVKNGDPGRYKP